MPIINADFLEYSKYIPDEQFDLIITDPPYVKETRLSNQTYEVEMTNDQHTKLCERLLTFKGKILLSGYDNKIYKILDSKFEKVSFQSPNSGSKAIEYLWRNY